MINYFQELSVLFYKKKYNEVIEKCKYISSFGLKTEQIDYYYLASLIQLNNYSECFYEIQMLLNKKEISSDFLEKFSSYLYSIEKEDYAYKLIEYAYEKKISTPDMLGNLVTYYLAHNNLNKAEEVLQYAIDNDLLDDYLYIRLFYNTNSKKVLIKGLKKYPNSFILITQLALIDHSYSYLFIEKLRKSEFEHNLVNLDVDKEDVFLCTSKGVQSARNGKKHDIFILGEISPRNLILIKRTSNSTHEEEELYKLYEKLLPSNIKLPKIFGTIQKDEYYYLIQERIFGKTLSSIIRFQKTPTIVEQTKIIIFGLANIYLNINISDIPEYNYKQKIIERWGDLQDQYKLDFNDWENLIKFFESSQYKTIYKDAWTDNWIITNNGEIYTIDNENRGSVSLAFEIAHFFHNLPQGNAKSRHKLLLDIINYVNEFASNDKKIDKEQFIYEYYAASLYRTFLNIRNCYNEKRQVMIDLSLIQNGINDTITFFFSIIDDEHKIFFQKLLNKINNMIEIFKIEILINSSKLVLDNTKKGINSQIILGLTKLPIELINYINQENIDLKSVSIIAIESTPNFTEKEVSFGIETKDGKIKVESVVIPISKLIDLI